MQVPTPLTPWTSANPYLCGAYAPVFDELDATPLRVEGAIPRSLNGVLMRNGPNPQFEPEMYVYPFDGTGMIHAVYIENGVARYRNRWVLTNELLLEREAGRRLFGSTLGPPPVANLANTNMVRHGGRYLALFEGGLPHELDRDLNTIGTHDYKGLLTRSMSAHPKIDPDTGEWIAVAYNGDSPRLEYIVIDRDGLLKEFVPLDGPWPAMVHDIAVTQNYVVVFVCPFVLDRPNPEWRPSLGTAVAIISRWGAERKIRWLKCAPFFHYHIMNAYETGTCIEVQLPWFSSWGSSSVRTRLELHRLRLNLDAATVADETIDDHPCEFPRINDVFAGRPNRYGYVAFRDRRPGESSSPGVFEAIARYDFQTGARTVRTLPAGHFTGEPVYASDPAGQAEDAGYIMAFVYDAPNDCSSLQIFDASNLNSDTLAKVHLPRRVPAGLHGSWMPERT